jgi:hypothetical protein
VVGLSRVKGNLLSGAEKWIDVPKSAKKAAILVVKCFKGTGNTRQMRDKRVPDNPGILL